MAAITTTAPLQEAVPAVATTLAVHHQEAPPAAEAAIVVAVTVVAVTAAAAEAVAAEEAEDVKFCDNPKKDYLCKPKIVLLVFYHANTNNNPLAELGFL